MVFVNTLLEFGNACKTDRVTGLQLIASIADLVLSLATQTLPGLEKNKGKHMVDKLAVLTLKFGSAYCRKNARYIKYHSPR